MTNKIQAVRRAEGLIVLEDDTADEVKAAVEKVSAIIEQNEDELRFEGKRIVEGAGFDLRIDCYDLFECPNGYLLYTHVIKKPNWAVTGRTLHMVLDRAPDQTVARRAHGELIKKGLISNHSH